MVADGWPEHHARGNKQQPDFCRYGYGCGYLPWLKDITWTVEISDMMVRVV